MKTCSKCHQEKELIFYSKNKKSKDGLRSSCKDCDKITYKKYREEQKTKDPDFYSNQYKKRKEKNPEFNKYHYQLRLKNGFDNNAKNKRFKMNNPDYEKKGNPGYRSYGERKEYIQKWLSNPINKLKETFRVLTNQAIKSKGLRRTKKSLVYLGCTIEYLKEHLEQQFLEGMTWDNHGEWHIDHIIPLSTALTEEDVYKLNHYTNLQPLWALDNQKKSNKFY